MRSLHRGIVFLILPVACVSFIGFAAVAALLAPRGFLFQDDDPLAYYVYLRSAVHDQDLEFSNEYRFFRKLGAQLNFSLNRVHPTTGRPDNQHTIGTPLLSAILYVPMTIALDRYYPADGTLERFPWFLDQVLFSCANIILGIVGLWFGFRFCTSFFPEPDCLLASLVFWMSSPLLYYLIREPFQSHLASVFSVSAILYLWRIPSISNTKRIVLLGMMCGVAAMVRLQDVLVIMIPAGIALFNRPTLQKITISMLLFIAGFLATFWIQMLVWYILRGSLISFPYTGQSFLYWMHPKWIAVLFSSNHGLLVWHPVVALCLAGLLMWRNHVGNLAFLCFIVHVLIIASWWDWFGGYSFGHRTFLGLTPLFLAGLAWILTALRGRARFLFCFFLALLCMWNCVLALAYLSALIPHAGEFSWLEMIGNLGKIPGKVRDALANL